MERGEIFDLFKIEDDYISGPDLCWGGDGCLSFDSSSVFYREFDSWFTCLVCNDLVVGDGIGDVFQAAIAFDLEDVGFKAGSKKGFRKTDSNFSKRD